MEEDESTGGGFVREKHGERQAGMIVDGDVEIFPAGAPDMIVLAVTGDAMTRTFDASEFLDVEVNEFAWGGPFIALDRWWWRELSQPKTMTAQQAGDRGFGEFGRTGDLKAWEPSEAERKHPSHPQRMSGAGRAKRT